MKTLNINISVEQLPAYMDLLSAMVFILFFHFTDKESRKIFIDNWRPRAIAQEIDEKIVNEIANYFEITLNQMEKHIKEMTNVQ